MRYAGIAQLVEHLIRNEGVVGSSPITGTRNKKSPNGDFFYDNLCITKPLRNFGSNHVVFGGIIFPVSAISII